MKLNVNKDGLVVLSNKLESLGKKHLPNAVRVTLNQAAFDTKKQVPITADEIFTIRNKSFFRSLTLVNMVSVGSDINKMKSEVGINATRLPKVTQNLATQEHGGTISNRNLIAMTQARVSQSNEKRVQRVNLLSKVTISKAKKKGTGTGFIMIKKGSKGTIFSTKNNKLKPIYSYQPNRSVKVNRSSFMRLSSLSAQKNIDTNFVLNAEKIIQRLK